MKAEKLKENPNNSDDDNEDKYADDFDMPGTKVDSKQRITVRNLRIREDTAKYLRNLDPNSAFYDPKTRSMRDNPNPQTNPEETDFAGENFVRYTGDTEHHARAQLFAWEAYGKGVDVHVLAEPTKLELLQKEYDKKRNEIKTDVQSSILDKYGGEEHLQAPPKALLLAQTEDYVEYSRYGKVLRGQEKPIVRSKYNEDVLINNHTSVFGSFYKNGQWGYKCCRSFIKNSYCVSGGGSGEERPAKNQEQLPTTSRETKESETSSSSSSSSGSGSSTSSSSSSSSSSSEEGSDKAVSSKRKKKSAKHKQNKKTKKDDSAKKLRLAMMAEENSKRKAELLMGLDERKRPYNSGMQGTNAAEPTSEELEAYHIQRTREEDPMLFLKKK